MNRFGRFWIPVAAVLVSPALLVAQEAEEGGGGSLFSINFGLMGWTLVVFLALLFVLGRYAWGPILDAVEAREDRIRDALDEAAESQAKAEALAEEQRKQLADARRQSQEIISEGREAGQRVRREIEEKARDEGQAMIERARREIEREKEAAIDELRKESVELALAAASKLLKKRLDADQDRELVLGYLDELEDEETGAEA